MSDPIRVLSVDDDPAMRAHLKAQLETAGFDTSPEYFIEASNGLEGYRALVKLHCSGRDPLLIVSDWEMPTMTGLDLLKRVRSDTRFNKVPFLLATGVSQQGAVVEAIKAGVSNYVVKPYEFTAFKPKLDAVLPKVEEYRKWMTSHFPSVAVQRRWLIVDNIALNRHQAVAVLSSMGFTEIIEAVGTNDAMEAITKYRSQGGFFGVLCDPNLRKTNNFELIQYCRSSSKADVRGFFLMGQKIELLSNELDLTAEGIDGQFEFPLTKEALLGAIGNSQMSRLNPGSP